jgi:putative ABC transport system permease protein
MSPTASIIDLSVWQLALALLLVAALVMVSVRQSLGLERDLVIGTVRTIVQLYAVGLILAAVFAAAHWYWVLVILGVMTGVATQAAVSRLRKPLPGLAWMAALALTVSTATTLAYVIGVVVQVRPWYTPQYIIPIAGMILGNSMTSAALATVCRAICRPAPMKSRRGSLWASPDAKRCSLWSARRSGRR